MAGLVWPGLCSRQRVKDRTFQPPLQHLTLLGPGHRPLPDVN